MFNIPLGPPELHRLTPQDATNILAKVHIREGSRKLHPAVLYAYTKMMNDGQWHMPGYNAMPVIINSKHELIDGHHRLTALSQSTRPIMLAIFTEIPIKQLIS